jgi:hypothetical protein
MERNLYKIRGEILKALLDYKNRSKQSTILFSIDDLPSKQHAVFFIDVLDRLKKGGMIDYQESKSKGEYVFNRKAEVEEFIPFENIFEISFLGNFNLFVKEYLNNDADPTLKKYLPRIKNDFKGQNKPPQYNERISKMFSKYEWEEITIQFLNGDEAFIKVNDDFIKSNFREMGFNDKRTKGPNNQWVLLKDLSENNGEISGKGMKTSGAGRKKKEKLSILLKNCFRINSDPFFNYWKLRTYKIKLNLLPIKNKSNDVLFRNSKDEETEEFLKEVAPSIADKSDF